MCGIAGLIAAKQSVDHSTLAELARAMAQAISSRGPDDEGVWVAEDKPLALSHRRLAILDLTAAGHQPMTSACGRFVIVFNGEIYNHLDLRAQLTASGSAPAWRGQSDTETLLAAFAAWGIEATLRAASGMFAVGLWDKQARRLILARDRMGEKPLYYGWQRGNFLFASELKAMHRHPAWQAEIDRDALTLFMRHGYVPTPHTIWRGISKLPPGCWLTIDPDAERAHMAAPQAYWSASEQARNSQQKLVTDEGEAIEMLEQVLSSSVERQSLADVPLGAFLSGGVDSSTIVALMQKHARRPVRTFAIGFDDENYDEAQYAAEVARHLGTEHTELYVTSQTARDVIPQLPYLYDEPFADSSQIPTFLVAQLARQHVTVALSGDGGDELFGGYNRYVWGERVWRRIRPYPQAARKYLANGIRSISPTAWSRAYSFVQSALPRQMHIRRSGDQLHKLAGILDVTDRHGIYRRLVSVQQDPAHTVLNGTEPAVWADGQLARHASDEFSNYMMLADQLTYLSDDILAKVDRAAMGVSLETRVPMLDPAVLEFAWHVPLTMKLRNNTNKWLLRQVLYKYVPASLIERPKTGFGIPLDRWLRGELREWAETLLAPDRLRQEGFLDANVVQRHWQAHLSGRENQAYWIWNVLMFQAWKERWL